MLLMIPGLNAPIPVAIPVVVAGILLLTAAVEAFVVASGKRALAAA